MFLCGAAPVLVSIYMLFKVKESDTWVRVGRQAHQAHPLRAIFLAPHLRRTALNAGLVTVSIIGLWAGAVYEPSAIVVLAKAAGHTAKEATRLASFGTGVLSVGTILGCLAVPLLAERWGRRWTLGWFFLGMALCIVVSFGWAFYLPNGLSVFITSLFFLGFFGGNFAMYSLWLPEQYPTAIRASAFAFVTSFGRFVGAGVNFLIGAGVAAYGSVGVPVAATAAAFIAGLLLLPWCLETRGEKLPS
jgi:MFS family permease